MTNAKLDAAADSMKSTMNATRRKMEEEYGAMLCCEPGCENEAHPQSCYCDEHDFSE